MSHAKVIRKTLIEIAKRRQRPGSGSARSFLLERTVHMHWPDLRTVLVDVEWAVVGAVATRLYMPERATRDLDIVVAVQNALTTQDRLSAAGWTPLGQLSIGGTSWRSPDDVVVDVLEGQEPWWIEAIRQAQSNRDAQGLPILPLSYLVLMKFRAGRTVDIGDLTRMLGQADEATLDTTRQLFESYEPDGIDDLNSLIALGQLEMQS